MKTMPDPDDLRVLLLDADGSLFPADAPADAGVVSLIDSWADVAAMMLRAAPVGAERRP